MYYMSIVTLAITLGDQVADSRRDTIVLLCLSLILQDSTRWQLKDIACVLHIHFFVRRSES